MVEIGNCVDCAFANFKWNVKDMEKEIPLLCPWDIEITLNILEGNCVMYKQSPAYELLMEKNPDAEAALRTSSDEIIAGLKRRENKDT